MAHTARPRGRGGPGRVRGLAAPTATARATVDLVGYERPSVGFSTETILVDIGRGEAPGTCGAGERIERLVLKLPPTGPAIFPTYDFDAAAPGPGGGGRGRHPGAGAGAGRGRPPMAGLALPGDAGRRRPHRRRAADPRPLADQGRPPSATRWCTAATSTCWPTSTASTGGRPGWPGWYRPATTRPSSPTGATTWGGTATVPCLVPQLVEALDWCAAHRPASEPEASLLWGDVRLGNVIFDEDARPGGRPRLGDGHDRRGRARPGLDAHARGHPGRAVRSDRPRLPRSRRRGGALRGPPGSRRCRTSTGTRSSPWSAAPPS